MQTVLRVHRRRKPQTICPISPQMLQLLINLNERRSRPRPEAGSASNSFQREGSQRPVVQSIALAGVQEKLNSITKHVTSALAADRLLSTIQPGEFR